MSFFYFTDEDISEITFRDRLGQTEQDLWHLLSVRSAEELLSPEVLTPRKHNAVINAVDGISALLGTFFRVGTRIALGAWTEIDTKALLSSIRFNDEGAENRALDLHRVIVESYTGRRLIGINRQQNRMLPPMTVFLVPIPRTLG